MFKDVPMKIVIPIIVITWVLSLISSLAIVSIAPGLLGIKAGIDEGAVTSDKIADEAVITLKMADGNVTSAKILDGTITTADLATGAVSVVNIAGGAVTSEKIADGSVTSVKIADNAIVVTKLADGQVTSAKILDGTITGVDLSDNAIVTVKIANGAITTEKIANDAITTQKIANGTITTEKIADYAIAAINLGNKTVTNEKLASDAIPFRSTSYTYEMTTNTLSPNWANLMSVSVTLRRESRLWIMFSGDLYQEAYAYIRVRVQLNIGGSTSYASPEPMILTPEVSDWRSYACNFEYYASGISSTTYVTVTMQWNVDAGRAHIQYRSLAVIALPA